MHEYQFLEMANYFSDMAEYLSLLTNISLLISVWLTQRNWHLFESSYVEEIN